MRRYCKAYMTVEACMVMPLVLMVYLFLMQYGVWAYDRCLLEFDMAAVLLRCAVSENPQLTYQRELSAWDKEKYIWVHSQEMTLEQGMLTLTLTGYAEGGTMGAVGIRYEMWRIEPELWLRGKRSLEDFREREDG